MFLKYNFFIFSYFIVFNYSLQNSLISVKLNKLSLEKAIDNYRYLYDISDIDRRRVISDIKERIGVETGYGFVPKNTNIIQY